MRTSRIIILALLLLFFMVSCDSAEDKTIYDEIPAEVTEPQEPISQIDDISQPIVTSQNEEIQTESSQEPLSVVSGNPPQNEQAPGHSPSASEVSNISQAQVVLTVTPLETYKTHESFTITDPAHVNLIRTAIKPENIEEIERSLILGASGFGISFADESGDAIEFWIVDYDSPDGRYIAAINDKHYLVDKVVWELLLEYYPYFDNRIKPLYRLEYENPGYSGHYAQYADDAPRAVDNIKEVPAVYNCLMYNLVQLESAPDMEPDIRRRRMDIIISYDTGESRPEEVRYRCNIPADKNNVSYVLKREGASTVWYCADETLHDAVTALISVDYEDFTM